MEYAYESEMRGMECFCDNHSREPTHLLAHFIELVNEADSLIRKDQRTALEGPLLGHGISVHTSSQTNRRRAFSGRIHRSRSDLLSIFQNLRLGGAGVTCT
jgi:hypothetical protein